MALGRKISLMDPHTGSLEGVIIPVVVDGENRKVDAGTLVQLNEEGKIDEDLLPPFTPPGEGAGDVIYDPDF